MASAFVGKGVGNVYAIRNALLKKNSSKLHVLASVRLNSTKVEPEVENETKKTSFESNKTYRLPSQLSDLRFLYPEFLPNPLMNRRHKVREKLERKDMLSRRRALEIPEFYVGSILAVTASDPYAPGKANRFVGICILREEHGLRATFTLRNVVDHQGVEIMYELYNPSIQSIEVLRLEKRLDEQLVYLRDALPEYSTIPFDMHAEPHVEGINIVNPLKVKMKPLPWFARWERMELKGVQDLGLDQEFYDLAEKRATPWVKYDMMKDYREHIHEEDQKEIWEDVLPHHTEIQEKWKKGKRLSLLKGKKRMT